MDDQTYLQTDAKADHHLADIYSFPMNCFHACNKPLIVHEPGLMHGYDCHYNLMLGIVANFHN